MLRSLVDSEVHTHSLLINTLSFTSFYKHTPCNIHSPCIPFPLASPTISVELVYSTIHHRGTLFKFHQSPPLVCLFNALPVVCPLHKPLFQPSTTATSSVFLYASCPFPCRNPFPYHCRNPFSSGPSLDITHASCSNYSSHLHPRFYVCYNAYFLSLLLIMFLARR